MYVGILRVGTICCTSVKWDRRSEALPLKGWLAVNTDLSR